ncbi:MAG TPA: PEP-CTERM sorting domain-containing protein [Tepidisphaeraceae bacterium]|jgi:hypothetical protein|nr:PEP-CTERM sorting domain-containing protein [Tepidisphaeraceae bacterium]
MFNRHALSTLFSAAAVVVIATGSVATAAPILEYKFETLASTGGDVTPVVLFGATQSAAGTGVTGGLGLPESSIDRAYSSTGGSQRASHAADNDNIDGLVSFTISGWYKTGGLTGRIMHNPNEQEIIPGTSTLTLSVNSSNAGVSAASYPQNNQWAFFAITYDGTATLNNVKYYLGFRTDAEATAAGASSAAVSLLTTATRNSGTTNNGTGALIIGNRNNAGAFDRAFVGLLDNFRIDGTKTIGDTGGALTATALESRRLSDVSAVPEPTGLAMVAAASGLLAMRRRRHFATR